MRIPKPEDLEVVETGPANARRFVGVRCRHCGTLMTGEFAPTEVKRKPGTNDLAGTPFRCLAHVLRCGP